MHLIKEVHAFALNQLRTRCERDVVVCERTTRTLSTVHAERDSYIDRSTVHRAGGIHNSQSVELCAIEVILQVSPVLIDHQTIGVVEVNLTVVATIADAQSLLHNLVRIQSRCVDLGGLVLSELLVLRLDDIAASESVLIDQTRLGRDLIELDFIPAILGHQLLDDVDAGTQDRQSTTILLVGHIQMGASDIAQMNSLLGRSILRRHPLRQKGRGLALNVKSKLMLDDIQSVILQRSIHKGIQVIPTTELRDQLHVALDSVTGIHSGSHILDNNTEEATLTLTTTYVADVEQALQSVHRVLRKRLAEHQDNVCVRAVTHSRTHSEHVKQIALGGLMGNSAILSHGVVSSILQTIQHRIHITFLLFLLSFVPQDKELIYCTSKHE